MGLSANTEWEVRTTGSDTNGGGFVRGASGTDWSQQNSPQYSVTDGVTNGSTTITSASASFGTDVVGNIIYVSGGTGSITADWYQIISRTNSTTIVVDRSTGLTTGTGVTLHIGGALATLNQSSVVAAQGHVVHPKDTATYTTATAIKFTGSSVPNTNPLIVQGYGTTRGDGHRITIQATAGLSGDYVLSDNAGGSGHVHFDSIKVDGNGQTGVNGFFVTNRGSSCFNCEVVDCDGYGIVPSGNHNLAWGCDVHGMRSGSITCFYAADAQLQYCVARASPCKGFSCENQNSQTWIDNCEAYGLTGGNGIGFYISQCITGSHIMGCVAYGNSQAGIHLDNGAYAAIVCNNNISVKNGTYNIIMPAFPSSSLIDWNALYGAGTADRFNYAAGPNEIILTGDPFISGATGDFRLNNIAGAGAALRGRAYPQTTPDGLTISRRDLGAWQHQDLGTMAQKVSNARSLQSFGATNLSAGGTLTATTWDLHVALGGLLTIRFVNGGTAPSTAPTAIVYVSTDGSTWRKYKTDTFTGVVSGDTVNSSTNDYSLVIPEEAMYVQVVFNGGTGQACGVEAIGQEMTALA